MGRSQKRSNSLDGSPGRAVELGEGLWMEIYQEETSEVRGIILLLRI